MSTYVCTVTILIFLLYFEKWTIGFTANGKTRYDPVAFFSPFIDRYYVCVLSVTIS